MKHFRKIWDNEKNEWLKTTKGMTPSEAYAKFLEAFPEAMDVTRVAFCNQRSRMGAAGECTNPNFSRKPKPLFSEQVKKGLIRIKIAQPNVWISKAKWIYQQAHPEEDLSERSNYIFLDGDTRNFDPANIERVKLKLMGIFNQLGGTVQGNQQATRLRLAQAKLKYAMLDAGEKLGLVSCHGHTRKFKSDVNAAAARRRELKKQQRK